MEENHQTPIPFSGWAGISGEQNTLDKRIYGILLNKEGRENHHRLIGGTNSSNISKMNLSHLSHSPSNAQGTFTATKTDRGTSQVSNTESQEERLLNAMRETQNREKRN